MLLKRFLPLTVTSLLPHLGVFSVVVSSGYESVAQGVQEVVEVFFGDGVSGRAVYSLFQPIAERRDR